LSYLIDTNVISELTKPNPNAQVEQWFGERDAGLLFLSVLTLGELRKGIESLPIGTKRQRLSDWFDGELKGFFAGRIVSVDEAVALRWAHLQSAAGRPLPAIDSLLAATALAHDLCLVTRNLIDFDHPGLSVFNPWAAHNL
jgi:predicted nucleic acid-binding protein